MVLALTRRIFNRWKKKRGQVLEELIYNDVAHFESWEGDICHLVRAIAVCPYMRLKPPIWGVSGYDFSRQKSETPQMGGFTGVGIW